MEWRGKNNLSPRRNLACRWTEKEREKGACCGFYLLQHRKKTIQSCCIG